MITAAAAYPVTAGEAAEWARIGITEAAAEANTIALLIRAMTAYAEHLTGRAFVERTLQLNLPCFYSCVELPWAPLQYVQSVKYSDSDNAEQTVTATDYEVDTVRAPGRIRAVYGGNGWPATGTYFNAVRIRYRAGYAPAGSPTDYTDNSYLPPELRMWMQARIATLYENREQIILNNQVEIPRGWQDGVLDPLVIGTRWF